jgi:cell division inhibitor SepF
MAGRLRNMALYLGLVDDEEQDEYYDQSYDESYDEVASRDVPSRDVDLAAVPTRHHAAGVSATRRAPSVTTAVRSDPRPTRPVADPYRITTMQPRTYNEARTIGEHFRDGVPVIINLTEMDDADAKRLVDFAAGLIFGLHGTIERVTAKVFLLSPSNVEVSAEDKAQIAQSGFFNQS